MIRARTAATTPSKPRISFGKPSSMPRSRVHRSAGSPVVKPPGLVNTTLSRSDSAGVSELCISASMMLVESRSPRIVPAATSSGWLTPLSARSRSWLEMPATGVSSCISSAMAGPDANSRSTSR